MRRLRQPLLVAATLCLTALAAPARAACPDAAGLVGKWHLTTLVYHTSKPAELQGRRSLWTLEVTKRGRALEATLTRVSHNRARLPEGATETGRAPLRVRCDRATLRARLKAPTSGARLEVRLDLDLSEARRLTGTFNYEGRSFRTWGAAGVLEGRPGAPPALEGYARQPCHVRCRIAYGGWRAAGGGVVFRAPPAGKACATRCDVQDGPAHGPGGTYVGRVTGLARGEVRVEVTGTKVAAQIKLGALRLDATGTLSQDGSIRFRSRHDAETLRFEGQLDAATRTLAGRWEGTLALSGSRPAKLHGAWSAKR